MATGQTTLKDIGKIAGVSARAVSAALNGTGRVSPELRDRIQHIALELNYRPNLMARGLVQQKSSLIGTVFPYANVSFFNDIISGIEERCSENGYDLLLGNANLIIENEERRALLRMINRNVDGILCAPDYRELELFRQLEKNGPPTIQVMTRIAESNLPFIGVDNVHGGFIATEHLIELGHRHIGFLTSSRPHYSEIECRYTGYMQALVKHGIRMDPQASTIASDLTIEGGYAAGRDLLRNNPSMTAIFAPTDYAAIGVLRAGIELGRSIPEELSVVGFDDLSIAAEQIVYPLTTISQPKREIGLTAFDMVSQMIKGETPENVSVKPQLIRRRTTASPSTD